MQSRPLRPNMLLVVIAFVALFSVMLACARVMQPGGSSFWSVSSPQANSNAAIQGTAVQVPISVPTNQPAGPLQTPTPDAPHPLPALRLDPEIYQVKSGDTLGQIARQYGVSLQQLIQENNLANPDLVEVGRTLTIPPPTPEGTGPDFKIIPDSELVYGPASVSFDTNAFVKEQGGYLASYYEEVNGESLSGAQVIDHIARDFSVNPRLLLAVLEYQSHWVTQQDPQDTPRNYPLGLQDQWHKGLYLQMSWAADNLNRGFYLWRVNGVAAWVLSDGHVVPVSPTINAGTAGVQNMFASLYDLQSWQIAVSEQGLFATYNSLFGYPFSYAVEPLLPAGLSQPTLQLPFEPGANWAFTGGPHGGWGSGSAWAALDFAPPGDAVGCVQSDAWVVAASDGVILRAGNGAVIQDLDVDGQPADGFEQTGWVLLYMHIETRDRIQPGTHLKAGDRIGHPSCEGGVSTGTHTHLARRYNGEWIAADQDLPFVLDGWVSSGTGFEYDGFLKRGGQTIEAYAGRSSDNGIQR